MTRYSSSHRLVGLAAFAPAAASEPLPELGYGWALLQMLVALALVCAVAYLALRFGLRRLAGPRAGGEGQHLKVIERCPLTAGRSLWLVRVGQRYLVVGDGEGGLQRIAELEPGEVDEVADGAPVGSKSFLELFRREGAPRTPEK